MTELDETRDASAIQEAWRRERPELPVASIGIITRIWHAAKLLSDDRRRTMRRLGMDEATRDLLATLRRAGEPYALAPGEVARRTGVSAAAISQRLTRAVEAGLVVREVSSGDGRGALIRLTSEGREAIDAVVGELLEHEQTLIEGLTTEQQRQLAESLELFLVDLRGRVGID